MEGPSCVAPTREIRRDTQGARRKRDWREKTLPRPHAAAESLGKRWATSRFYWTVQESQGGSHNRVGQAGNVVHNLAGFVIYPGFPDREGITEPVASIRLKSFRRGAQDYEYLRLL